MITKFHADESPKNTTKNSKPEKPEVQLKNKLKN